MAYLGYRRQLIIFWCESIVHDSAHQSCRPDLLVKLAKNATTRSEGEAVLAKLCESAEVDRCWWLVSKTICVLGHRLSRGNGGDILLYNSHVGERVREPLC